MEQAEAVLLAAGIGERRTGGEYNPTGENVMRAAAKARLEVFGEPGGSPTNTEATPRETWYFTFGSAHRHANHYFVVENATYDEARERMVALFGRDWAFQYDETQWHEHGVSQAEKYGLERLP